jgi:antitoxin component of MazEF toxin-antitoxin module
MQTFEAQPKKWGNSLGITIPKDVVKERKLKPGTKIKVMIMEEPGNVWKETFGTLKFKRSTKELLREAREGLDD